MSSRHWPRRAPLPGPNTWLAARKSEAGRPPRAPAPRPAPAPRLGRRELRGPRLGPRDAAVLGPRPPEPAHRRSAGSRCRPCGPPAPPSLSLFHTVCSSSGRRRPGRQSPRSPARHPAPRTSEAACAPPPCALGRGLAALPPPRPLSRRGRWSRLPGVARPEPLDSGISHHAAPTRPGPAALCGPGRGRGASPAGLREDTRVRSSWPRPGRAGSPHGREPRATARPAPRPADLAPRAPASASPSVSGLALGPRTCSGVVTGAASGPDPTRLAQRVPACPADAQARGQRS